MIYRNCRLQTVFAESVKFLFLSVLCLIVSGDRSYCATIFSAGYFNQPGDRKIDFESMPGITGVPAVGTRFTDVYPGLLFRSETTPHIKQNTDKEDAAGRFGKSFQVYQGEAGGGRPTSGIRYVSSTAWAGWNVPDLRVDFLTPVDAFGMFIIDNDFSIARISAYNQNGTLLHTLNVPQVSEGGVTYRGIAVPGISYFILDAANNGQLDSTVIDDLSYRPQNNPEVPEPSCSVVILLGLFAGFKRLRLKRCSSAVKDSV
ncbi:MAG: hypothetical protein ACK42H_14645 [Planctomycetota bacterium]